MTKFYLLFIFLLLCLTNDVMAGVLKGTVTDDKGDVLPYATIYVEGTTFGVSAGGDGNYQLQLAPGKYKVICSFIGFKQTFYSVAIAGGEVKEHNFQLGSLGLIMKEVVVKASSEDPAYAIMRRAVARRKYHLDQITSFHTGLYFKGVVRSRKLPKKFMGEKILGGELDADTTGKGILYLAEEDADYYARGEQERTIIHSVKESGNPNGVGFARFPPVIPFYRNNINLSGKDSRGFISPVSDNALNYYKYRLEGQFEENGHTIYKIKVTQRRLYEPTFTGTIYIVDGDFAIHSLDLFLTNKSNLDLLDTLRIQQVYLPLEKDNWIIKNQVLYYAVKLLGFDITGSGVTVYDNQAVNEEIPDDVFNDKLISSYDKTANKKDTSYWTLKRPVPLQRDEDKDYNVMDSIYKKQQMQVYKDSVTVANNKLKITAILVSGPKFSSKNGADKYTLNPLLLGILNFNSFEGYTVSPKVTCDHLIDSGKYLRGAAAVRYGFHDRHLDPIARLDYITEDRSWRNRSWTIGVQGGKYVFQYDPDNPVLPEFNTVAALFYAGNDLKIYEREEATIHLSRNYGNGLKWNISLSYQQRTPFDSTGYSYTYGLLGKPDLGYTQPVPDRLRAISVWQKNDAALAHINVSYQPGYRYVQYPDYKIGFSSLPVFTFTYDKGIPGILNSISDFDKWRFEITHNFRVRRLGNISYNVAAGGFLNTNVVAAPDLMHIYGNRGIGYASPYLRSFQFAQYYAFSNKENLYGEAHVEYNLQGLLSDKIPLMQKARWYFILGNNTFYARQNDYYTEAFIAIDNIGYKAFRYLRLDFVQSWDSYGGHNSGIRFGLKLPSLIVVNSDTEKW
jgi:hypothetical protein